MVYPGSPPLLLWLLLPVFLTCKSNHDNKRNRNTSLYFTLQPDKPCFFRTVSMEAVLGQTQQLLFSSTELLLPRFNPLHPEGKTVMRSGSQVTTQVSTQDRCALSVSEYSHWLNSNLSQSWCLTVSLTGPWMSFPPPILLWQLWLWKPQWALPPWNAH